MRTKLLLAVTAVVAGVVAGVVALAAPALAASTTVTGKDKGTTVSVHVGDTLHVSLSSTAWTIAAASSPALVAQGAQSTTFVPGPTCHPGQGCGTTDRTFRAAQAGTAQLVATRTQCGEALQCTGDNGRWSMTVKVLGTVQPRKLPFTGAPVGRLLLLALGLVVTGAWFTRAGRATP